MDLNDLELQALTDIERGAAALTGVNPAWREHVDADNLDLRSQTGCVLGQLVVADAANRDAYDAAIIEVSDDNWLKNTWRRGPMGLNMSPAPYATNCGFDPVSSYDSVWRDAEFDEDELVEVYTQLWRDELAK